MHSIAVIDASSKNPRAVAAQAHGGLYPWAEHVERDLCAYLTGGDLADMVGQVDPVKMHTDHGAVIVEILQRAIADKTSVTSLDDFVAVARSGTKHTREQVESALAYAADVADASLETVRALCGREVKAHAATAAMVQAQTLLGQGEHEAARKVLEQASQSLQEGSAPRATRMSSVRPRKIRWILEHFIARGRVHDVSGPGSGGKSTVLADLVARVSRGRPLHDGSTCPVMRTLWLTSEELLDEDLAPRWLEMGADLDMVDVMTPTELAVDLRQDSARLQRVIEQGGYDVVILDPLASFCGDADINKAGVIRPIFDRLNAVCLETDTTMLVIRHHKKGGDTAVNKGAGATTFTDAVRVATIVAKDPETGEHIWGVVKGNRSERHISYAFALKIRETEWGKVPVVECLEQTPKVRDLDAICTPAKVDKRETPDDDAVLAAIREALWEPMTAADVYSEVAAVVGEDPDSDAFRRTLRRRARKLGVQIERDTSGHTMWSL